MPMKKFTISEDLNDWEKYPGMARWFSPRLLFKIIQKVIASTIFGQYADKRVMHASLDVPDEKTFDARCGVKSGLSTSAKDPLWLDYVADLGDGFDSTYAIAYLIGQQQITVGDWKLPRAACLVMGGDQVYPDASRDDYHRRLQQPYESAFPRTESPGSEHPSVFLIPGNHDWYDGLTLFLAKFCRGRDTHLGSWVARQSRSYFAIHLKDNWWVWGFDSQLGEDIDIPQANYFVEVARKMKPGSKVILCASVPSWLAADEHKNTRDQRGAFGRGLDYISGILRDECKGAKIPVVLSGDLHHYSRFIAEPTGTSFITAGGGGAFLHPTHGLPTSIALTWVSKLEKLKIALKKVEKDKSVDVCYPSRETSRRLVWGNLWFLPKNLEFCLTLGGIYWVAAALLLAWNGYGETSNGSFLDRFLTQLGNITTTPIFLAVVASFFFVLRHYADVDKKLKNRVGGVHALIQLTILIAATAAISVLIASLKTLPFGEILYFAALGLGMVIAGAVGGIVWGIYLLVTSYSLNGHPNDAFSAMRLDSYRHFLRMKIERNKLTIYPIGIDKSPQREDWEKNKAYQPGNQNTPFFVPKTDLGQHFIEEPIVIDASLVRPLRTATK